MAKLTVTEIINIDELKAWLRTKPEEETYVYGNCLTCCMAQFAMSKHPGSSVMAGSNDVDVYIGGVGGYPEIIYLIPENIYEAVYNSFRFSEVLRRLEDGQGTP